MKKTTTLVTTLILAAVFAVSGLFAVLVTPFNAIHVRASGTNGRVPSVLADFSVVGLPRQTAMVDDYVQMPRARQAGDFGGASPSLTTLPFAPFALFRGNVFIGVSEWGHPRSMFNDRDASENVLPVPGNLLSNPSAHLSYPQFTSVATYQFRFFDEIDAGRMSFNDGHFQTHTVNVTREQFEIGLPTNTPDIIPNISVPNLPITFPVPDRLEDTRGRNLFAVEFNVRTRQYEVPHLEHLENLYPSVTALMNTAGEHYISANNPVARLRRLQLEVWADMTIHFEGTDGRLQNAAGNTEDTLGYRPSSGGVPVHPDARVANRTFTPVHVDDGQYAEYTFANGNRHRASLRTGDIRIDQARSRRDGVGDLSHSQVTGVNPDGTQRTVTERRNEQIRFDFNRISVASEPTGLQLNRIMPLPTVNLPLSNEPDEGSRAFNPVSFAHEVNYISNFSWISAQVRPLLDNGNFGPWQYARTPLGVANNRPVLLAGASNQYAREGVASPYYYTRITDFQFIPTTLGEFLFTYHTTTIFGPGYDHEGDQVVEMPAGSGNRYIRHRPFTRDIILNNTNVTTQILWTYEFEYNASGVAVDGGQVVDFANRDSRAQDVPSGATTMPPQIANQRLSLTGDGIADADNRTNIFRLPALLGDSSRVNSRYIYYNITVGRIGTIATSRVTFTNNMDPETADSNLQIRYDNTRYLEFRFGYNANWVEFNNGQGWTRLTTLEAGGNNNRGEYEFRIWATDGPPGVGRPTSTQIFTIEVTDAYTMHNTRPTFTRGLQLQQTTLYAEDTLRFRPVTASDEFTDGTHIAISYYLQFERAGSAANRLTADQIFWFNGATLTPTASQQIKVDVTDMMELVGGELTLLLREDESALAHDILSSVGGSALDVTIVAVARNFFALQHGLMVDPDATPLYEQLGGIAVTSTTIRVLDMNYATSTAILRGLDDNGAPDFDFDDRFGYYDLSLTPDYRSWWDIDLVEANIAADNLTGELRQNSRVYLPTIGFLNHDLQERVATIRMEVVQPRSNRAIPLSLNSTPGPIPADGLLSNQIKGVTDPAVLADDPRANDVFFVPSEVGRHTVRVIVTNAGGNMSVFVATLYVTGVAQVRLATEGGVETMRVGQSASLPTVTININGQQYETDGFRIFPTFEYDATGAPAEYIMDDGRLSVGSYRVLVSSSNTSPARFILNQFAPEYAGTFTFEFVITLNQNALTFADENVLPGLPIVQHIEHRIVVTQLLQTDVLVRLIDDEYNALANAAGGSTDAWVRDGYNANGSPRYIQNGEIPTTSIFTQFTASRLLPGETNFAISDARLEDGLERLNASTATVGRYQYGKIYLPSAQRAMVAGLNEPGSFRSIPSGEFEVDVTVTAPNAAPGDYLLDTRDMDSATRNHYARVPTSYSPVVTWGTGANAQVDGGQQFFWFRPQGEILVDDRYPADHPTMAGRIRAFRPVDRNVRVDGEYIVTYTFTFQNVTSTLTFRLLLGDNVMPRINFVSASQMVGTEHGEVQRAGNNRYFVVSTRDIMIAADGSRTVFNAEYVARNMTISVIGPGNTSMTPGQGDGQIRVAHTEADFDAFLAAGHSPTDGSIFFQEWRIPLHLVGQYSVTLRLWNDAETRQATRFFEITVDQRPTPNRASPQEVWGIVLIVFASGLALAVLIYFIKTGRDLKFAREGKAPEKKGKGGKAKGVSPSVKPEKIDQV